VLNHLEIISRLEAENAQLKAEKMALQANQASLKQANDVLTARVAGLEEKVRLLLEQLAQKPPKKDSHNSHNPPSNDKSKPKRTRCVFRKKVSVNQGS